MKSESDTLPFHPYYTAKDGFGLGIFLILYTAFVFFPAQLPGAPGQLHSRQPALHARAHRARVVFLAVYAILRAFTGDFGIPFTSIVLIPAKLLGVLAMFAAILVWFFLPWLDRSPVRSGHYRPLFRKFFWFGLLPCMAVLFWCGGAPAEEPYVMLSQLATAYYFLHFLVVLPIVSLMEKPQPLPFSITEAVLDGDKEIVKGEYAEPVAT